MHMQAALEQARAEISKLQARLHARELARQVRIRAVCCLGQCPASLSPQLSRSTRHCSDASPCMQAATALHACMVTQHA